jgi:hypothetical protein
MIKFYFAGAILLSMPVLLFVLELGLSPCVSGSFFQVVGAIATYVALMVAEVWAKPRVLRFIGAACLATIAWVVFQPHVLCACHVQLWLLLLNHLHNLCTLAKTDFKWSFDTMRDVFRSYGWFQ